jgi:hypothetical protein
MTPNGQANQIPQGTSRIDRRPRERAGAGKNRGGRYSLSSPPYRKLGPGLIWPPVIRGGVTEGIVLDVVAELHREFDASD